MQASLVSRSDTEKKGYLVHYKVLNKKTSRTTWQPCKEDPMGLAFGRHHQNVTARLGGPGPVIDGKVDTTRPAS